MKKLKFVGILFLGSLFLAACSGTNNDAEISKLKTENTSLKKEITELKRKIPESTADSDKKESSTDPAKEVYGLNEEAFIIKSSSNEKMYGLKIIKATTALEDNSDLYTDGKPENTVQVTYEYTNYKMPKPMMILSQYLSAYDTKNVAGKGKGLMDGQTNVTEGKTSQTTTWFVMNEKMTDKKEIEIEYANDYSQGFQGSRKFIVPLEH